MRLLNVLLATSLLGGGGALARAIASNPHDDQYPSSGLAVRYPAVGKIPHATGLDAELSLAYSPPYYPSPWIDGSGDWKKAHQKAVAFVKKLTLLEKVNLTTGVGWESEACVGNVGSVPRLGFRALCLQDSPLGIRFSDYNSAFPAGGTVAASWDRHVWYDRGRAMGEEFDGKGIDVQLGPVVGPLGRAPEAGRNWEGFSPDPYLSGVAVSETVKGIQSAGVVACTKHYIGNEQEHFRQALEAAAYGFDIKESISSNIDDVTLHELYLWPFADAIRAGTGSIMCSYNQVNNSYACQNSYLLNYILKGELGFQGFVMSDWSAQHTGVASSLAGLDMSMPGDISFDSGTTFWGTNLTIAVLNGTVPEWRLDDMVTRIMAAYYYVGRDTHQVPVNFNSWTRNVYGYEHAAVNLGYGKVNYRVDVRRNHGELIRSHATKSTVLLKNKNGTLPLTGKERFVALFGDDAGNNPLGPDGCTDRGCDSGTLAMGWGSGTSNLPYLISPQAAIQNQVVKSGGEIQWVFDDFNTDAAANLATMASVSIVFVNADSGEGYIAVDGNEGDRNNLTLWHNADNLVKTVASNSNNTIVVIHSVGQVLIGSWVNHPNVTAILWAGLPGEQSGNAITDILYGKSNPGGKLPFTLAVNRTDYGTDVMYQPNNGVNAPQDNFSEGIFIDYRYFDKQNITPIYEFGYGLSYTTFKYSNISIQRHNPPPYTPNVGSTSSAPTLGPPPSPNPVLYQFPANLTQIPAYIYPYLNSTNLKLASGDPNYGLNDTAFIPPGATDSSPQPKIRAGGAPGGNPRLYDVFYTVTATITNTGSVPGDEVAQLYINLGGPNDAPKVLRGFDRLKIQPGKSVEFKVNLHRKDVMNWNSRLQDWEVTKYKKTVYVGASSRNLPLSAELP